MTRTEERHLPDPAGAREYFAAKLAYETAPAEVERLRRRTDEAVIVDVRARRDYDEAHVPGALSLPKDRWSTAEGLAKDKVNILYCYSQSCHLAARAAAGLAAQGFPVMVMEGGFAAWREHKLPVEQRQAGEVREDEDEEKDEDAGPAEFHQPGDGRPRDQRPPTAPSYSGQFSPPY